MTVVRVKGFQIFRDRHGRWRCYHRLYDVQDCDRWINSLKNGIKDDDAADIVSRLGIAGCLGFLTSASSARCRRAIDNAGPPQKGRASCCYMLVCGEKELESATSQTGVRREEAAAG